MPVDAPDLAQTPAESAQPSAPSDPQPQPAPQDTERKGLASLADALRQSSARSGTPADDAGRDGPKGTTDPGRPGDSADEASNPRPAARASAADDTPEPGDGDSTETVSNPAPERTDAAPKANGKDGPSRRERAEIRDLTVERDALKGEVEQLRAAFTIPDHVRQQAIGSRLSDDEFEALRTRRERQTLTGDYLTPDEDEKLDTAIRVRDWSQPWYADAQQRAADWVETQRRGIFDEQAKGLAPVLRESDYLEADPIARAASWTDIYRYIRDASHAAGREAGLADLRPKLEAAEGRIHDLEAELSDLRHGSGGRIRTFERGGQSGGAFTGAAPDFKTASSHDLFAAAEERAARERARRTRRSA